MKNKKRYLLLIIPLFIMTLFLFFGCDKNSSSIKVYDFEKKLLTELKDQTEKITINEILDKESLRKENHFVYKVEIERKSKRTSFSDKNVKLLPPFNLYIDQRPYSELETLEAGKRLIDLSGIEESQIIAHLMSHNISINVQFVYEKKAGPSGRFLGYVNYEVGDIYVPNEVVQIIISKPEDIKLPSLEGKSKDEALKTLKDLHIPESLIEFISVHKPDSLDENFVGTYTTGYSNLEVGAPYEISEEHGQIIYINCYENREYTLTGDILKLNKHQLKDHSLYRTNSFPRYTTDETKETDTLAYIEFLDKGTENIKKTVNENDKFTDNDLRVYDLRHVYYKDTNNLYEDYDETNFDKKQLFISKVLHNKLGPRALELYNPTNEVINLAEYKISIIKHGDLTPTKEVTLSGMLQKETTFLIINNNATALEKLGAIADIKTNDLSFNALDIIQLRKVSNNTYYDTINNIGSSNLNNTENELLIRRDKELYNYYGNGKYGTAAELYPITHGSTHFSADYFKGYIATYYKPLLDQRHPYVDDQVFNFEEFKQVNFGNKGYYQGGIGEATLTSKVDGDTAGFRIGGQDVRVRYYYNDTPEKASPTTGLKEDERGALEATVANNTMLDNATKLYVANPLRGLTKNATETYGRGLGYIISYEEGTNKYIIINIEMLELGWTPHEATAKPEEYESDLIINNRYAYQLVREAAFNARTNRTGLFAE